MIYRCMAGHGQEGAADQAGPNVYLVDQLKRISRLQLCGRRRAATCVTSVHPPGIRARERTALVCCQSDKYQLRDVGQ